MIFLFISGVRDFEGWCADWSVESGRNESLLGVRMRDWDYGILRLGLCNAFGGVWKLWNRASFASVGGRSPACTCGAMGAVVVRTFAFMQGHGIKAWRGNVSFRGMCVRLAGNEG